MSETVIGYKFLMDDMTDPRSEKPEEPWVVGEWRKNEYASKRPIDSYRWILEHSWFEVEAQEVYLEEDTDAHIRFFAKKMRLVRRIPLIVKQMAAVKFALHTLPIYEALNPCDGIPREALELAEKCLSEPSEELLEKLRSLNKKLWDRDYHNVHRGDGHDMMVWRLSNEAAECATRGVSKAEWLGTSDVYVAMTTRMIPIYAILGDDIDAEWFDRGPLDLAEMEWQNQTLLELIKRI